MLLLALSRDHGQQGRSWAAGVWSPKASEPGWTLVCRPPARCTWLAQEPVIYCSPWFFSLSKHAAGRDDKLLVTFQVVRRAGSAPFFWDQLCPLVFHLLWLLLLRAEKTCLRIFSMKAKPWKPWLCGLGSQQSASGQPRVGSERTKERELVEAFSAK